MAVDPSAITDVTHELILESNAVIDITKQNVEALSAVIDTTQHSVEAPSAVIDTTQHSVEAPSAVIDSTQQSVEAPSAVIDTTQQSVEAGSAIKNTTERSVEAQSAVADTIEQSVEERISVTDITEVTELTTETDITGGTELTAVTDITEVTTEERSAKRVILQTIEEQNAVKDVTREAPQLTAIRYVTQRRTKEPKAERDATQRKFGYVKVSWEIENFFLVVANEEWEISSPEFDVDGCCVTRWRLILKVKKNNEGNNQNAYLCLENLNGENDTRDMRVCWNMWYKIAGEKLPLCDRENLIKSNCFLTVLINNFELIKMSLQVNLQTSAFLEGLILVRDTENGVVFKRSEDLGVKRLSEDISIVYSISQHQSRIIEYESFSDLKINTEGYPLICHKPILSARNKALNEAIDKSSGRSEIDINFSRGKAGRKIFQYLYSGNLTHILRLPSISIDKAINYLGMDELKCYYLKDSIHLLTRFEAEEIYFKWIVMDLNSDENFLFSPIFSREKSGLAVRLRLGLNKDFPEATFLSLKLYVIEGNTIPEFYFLSGIANNDGKIVSRRARRWTSDCELEIPKFTSKSVLKDSSLTGSGHLTILCSIVIPEGTQYRSVVKIQKCLRPELDHERHYRLLSTQLNTLFESSKHSDLEIKCGEETFKVHKCVLFARSPVFRRAIRQMQSLKGKKSKGFTMHDFDPKILHIVLHYIYSGILNCKKEDILPVYEGSKKLSMVTLQNQLYEILLNNLDVSNAIGTLELAVENSDFRLVESVCLFMKNNINEIKLQKNWDKFMRNKESLYEKLKEYARDHLKVCENV